MRDKECFRFKLHPYTIVLLNQLKTISIGDTISYNCLSTLINCNVQTQRGRGYLNTARKRLMKDERFLFEVDINVGLKRLNNVEKIEEGGKAVKKIRRAARRGGQKMKTVEVNELNNANKTKYFARLSKLGAIYLFSTNHRIKMIEDNIVDKPRLLEFKPTLDMFKRKD